MAHPDRKCAHPRRASLAGLAILVVAVAACPRPSPAPKESSPVIRGSPDDAPPDRLRQYLEQLSFDTTGDRPQRKEIQCAPGQSALLLIAPESRVRGYDPRENTAGVGQLLARITLQGRVPCRLFGLQSPADTAYMWIGRLDDDPVSAHFYVVSPGQPARLVAVGTEFRLRRYSWPFHRDPGEPRARFGSGWVSCSGGCCDSGKAQRVD